jgi:hypothetical protein
MVTLAADSVRWRSSLVRVGAVHGGEIAHRARLLLVQQHVGHAMLQRLEAADGLAELAAGLEVIDGGGHGGFHDADGFGAEGREADVQRRIDGLRYVDRRVASADFRGHGLVEQHVGRTLAVERRIAAQRDAGCCRGKRKQPHAAIVAPCRYQQQVGTVGMGHHGLAAAELGIGNPHGFVTRILVREHHDAFAGGDPGQPSGLKVGAGGTANQRRGDHGGGKIGFEQQPGAEGIHCQAGFERAIAQPSMVLVDADGQYAKFGQFLPDFAAPARGRVADAAAALEAVVPGDETTDSIGQRTLVVGEVEIHVAGPHSPMIICEMMFFWISLEPPKIDSLRRLQ